MIRRRVQVAQEHQTARNAEQLADIVPALLIGREVMARTPAGGTREMIEAAFRMEPGTELGRVARELGNGSLVTAPETVPFVIWSALRSLDDFADAMVTTVEAGGDCDTNAAMVGSILVARLGAESIPVEWLEARESLPPLA